MDDIGDIIYVVAMIIAVAYSAFRKANKSKRKSPLPNNTVPPSSHPMDEDEEEPYIDDLRELFRPKATIPDPVIVKPKPEPMFQQKKKQEPIIRTKAVTELGPEVQDVEFDTDEIDLRKAVIYSEILNRPYQ